MKIALLSDIHGNADALESVLKEIKKEGISILLIAGDFIGYYYEAAAVFRLLRDFQVIACKGNHEDYFEEWIKGNQEKQDTLLKQYGHSFAIGSSELMRDEIEWLLNLKHPVPCIFDEKKIILSHGSPWDQNLYLYENTISQYHSEFKRFALSYDLVIIGHSHYQFSIKLENLLVVNPGSVGQPRSGQLEQVNHGQGRAQWAILCCQSGNIELKTTFYPIYKLISQIEKYDNNLAYLKNVLLRR